MIEQIVGKQNDWMNGEAHLENSLKARLTHSGNIDMFCRRWDPAGVEQRTSHLGSERSTIALRDRTKFTEISFQSNWLNWLTDLNRPQKCFRQQLSRQVVD